MPGASKWIRHFDVDGACGICDLTGRRIPAARLRAVPWTRFSVTSETELERNGAMGRPRLGLLWSVRKVANGVVERSRVAPELNVIRPLRGCRVPVPKSQKCERSTLSAARIRLLASAQIAAPGSCCSNRKQPERSLLVTAVVEATGAKRSRNGDHRLKYE
jgi:hypothetical protein